MIRILGPDGRDFPLGRLYDEHLQGGWVCKLSRFFPRKWMYDSL